MRALYSLAALCIATLAIAACWRAHRLTLALLAALAGAYVLLGALAGLNPKTRRWQAHLAAGAVVGLAALSRIAWPNSPSLGLPGLIACHVVVLGAYLARLLWAMVRSDRAQRVEEGFMRLDLWWVNGALVVSVFAGASVAMEGGIALSGAGAALRWALAPLSAVCLYVLTVCAARGEAERGSWVGRLVSLTVFAAILGALALPLARGALAARALAEAERAIAFGQNEEARRELGVATRHNAFLQWPPFETRRRALEEEISDSSR